MPYIFVAPPARDTIGEIARDVYRRHYGGLLQARRSPQLAFLGRFLDADADALHGELLSYLFFAPEFARELVKLREGGRGGVAGGAARRRAVGYRPARSRTALSASAASSTTNGSIAVR